MTNREQPVDPLMAAREWAREDCRRGREEGRTGSLFDVLVPAFIAGAEWRQGAPKAEALTDAQILTIASNEFPRWSEDIQAQFVIRLVRAALAHAQRPAPEDEADSILRAIGLDPETYRTDGGALNLRKIKAAISHPSEYARSQVTEEMVGRFLCWRLPDNFAPDAGISFKRVYNETSPYGPSTREPRGTNLLNAEQARKMLEHVCASAQRPAPDPAAGVAPDSFSEWGEDDVSWAKEAAAQRPAGPATPERQRLIAWCKQVSRDNECGPHWREQFEKIVRILDEGKL